MNVGTWWSWSWHLFGVWLHIVPKRGAIRLHRGRWKLTLAPIHGLAFLIGLAYAFGPALLAEVTRHAEPRLPQTFYYATQTIDFQDGHTIYAGNLMIHPGDVTDELKDLVSRGALRSMTRQEYEMASVEPRT